MLIAGNAPNGIKFPVLGFPVGNVTMNYVTVNYISAPATYALKFESNGVVTLSHINATSAAGGGIYIENSNVSLPKNVTLLDIYAPGSTGEYAIYVHSKGAISAKDLDVYDYGSRLYGVKLDNSVSGATGGVTVGIAAMTYYNNMDGPTNEGLNILSNGPVSVANVNANGTGNGITINNQGIGLSGTGCRHPDEHLSGHKHQHGDRGPY